MTGMMINWMIIPGKAVMNALEMKAIQPNSLPTKLNKMVFAIPITSRPPIMAPIKEIYIFPFVSSYNSPVSNPYVASSNIMEIPIGKIGGAPVKTYAKIGKVAPHSTPNFQPHRIPQNSTGICIGNKTAPILITGIIFMN